MRDFLGNLLEIGDEVVYITTTTNSYEVGHITKLNQKTANILCKRFGTVERRDYSKIIKVVRGIKDIKY